MSGTGVVLAHQGGWDEALMVITPVALFAGLFWAATKRAAGHQDDPTTTDHRPEHP